MSVGTKVSPQTWRAAVSYEAAALGVDPAAALSRSRMAVCVLIRARAFKSLRDTGRYSLTGLGKVSGYDHTSVMSVLRSLPKQEARFALRRDAWLKPYRPKPPIPIGLPPVPVFVSTAALRRAGYDA